MLEVETEAFEGGFVWSLVFKIEGKKYHMAMCPNDIVWADPEDARKAGAEVGAHLLQAALRKSLVSAP